MTGQVPLWWVGYHPPELIAVRRGEWAVFCPVGLTGFLVLPAERRGGPLPLSALDEQVQRATNMAPPDCLIGGYRIIAIGRAWARPDLVARLRRHLASAGDRLVVAHRPSASWWRRMLARLRGESVL
jgi:hypothetical protein